MILPPVWEQAQLVEEARIAITKFRNERLVEPLENWKRTVDHYQAMFSQLFRVYGLENPANLSPAQVAEMFKTGLGDALRYMAGPPISEDDLRVLADCSLAPGRLGKNPQEAVRVLEIIVKTLDPRRFPWLAENRVATVEERDRAVLASAVLITAQRVSTARRSGGKNAQEASVQVALRTIGFRKVKPRTIRTLTDAPEPGEFSPECLVGSRKADIPVRLLDGRLMPIECKVSNSSTNSVKRLNNDAAVKAAIWHREFGTNQVVPTAVLSGVFNALNLEQAQTGGLTLFWAHRLNQLTDFITSTER